MKIRIKSLLKKLLNRLPNAVKSIVFNLKNHDKNYLLSNFYQTLISQEYFPKVIYDIGANTGTWTEFCIYHFPNANYYLFEPQPLLKRNIENRLGKFDNVKLFSVGVGNLTGELLFTYHDRDDSCTFNMTEADAKRHGYKQIKTPIVDLDTFIKDNGLDSPDLLKIDAEGLDIEVLDGARFTLEKHVEIVLVEVGVMNKFISNDALSVLTYMEKLGFKLFDITDLNRPFTNKVLWLCEFAFIKKNGKLDKDYSSL